MKKKKIWLITLAILLTFFSIQYIYHNYKNQTRIQNVFDQMYYTRMDMIWLSFDDRYYSGLFNNMKQTRSRGSTLREIYWEIYIPESLEPNTELRINFYPEDELDSKRLRIEYSINTDDEKNTKWYYYTYDLSNRTLSYSTNDPGNEENKMFLYNILLKDWFEANPNTRFSMDNLGKFTLIEETNKK